MPLEYFGRPSTFSTVIAAAFMQLRLTREWVGSDVVEVFEVVEYRPLGRESASYNVHRHPDERLRVADVTEQR